MKKYLLQLIILISVVFYSSSIFAQFNYEWSAHFGGSNTDYAYGIAIDNEGNVISGGEFRFTIDFDPADDSEASLTSSGLMNAYISKLNADGSYAWARQIEGESRVHDVHTDDDGNVFVCGRFRETIVFMPGKGGVSMTSNGQYDSFLAKYNADGDFLWAFQVGGIYQDFMNSLTIDADGNVFVCGEFTDTVDFDPSLNVGELNETSGVNTWDAFVAKYDNDGNYIWARQFGGESLQNGVGIDVCSNGDVVVAGHFSGITDFDPGAGELVYVNQGNLDWEGYLVRLNTNGVLVWGKSFGGVKHEWLYGMTIDENDNVFAVGGFNSITADFDPGNGEFEMATDGFVADPYIVKVNGNGEFVWAKQFEGPAFGACYAVAAVNGKVITTGSFSGNIDFDPGSGTVIEPIGGSSYFIFFSVLSDQGEYLWSDWTGSGTENFGYAVVADDQYFYSTGTFRGTSVWFGNNQFFNSAGHDDIFVTKVQHSTGIGIAEAGNSEMIVYPNPVEDYLTLKGIPSNTNVRLVDLHGKIVLNKMMSNNSIINTSHLAPGVYTLVVEGNDFNETRKVVVVE